MMEKYLQERNLCSTFVPAKKRGAIAQLVEQRTENPCVPGSIPGGTTSERQRNGFALGHLSWSFFYVHTPERINAEALMGSLNPLSETNLGFPLS